MKNNYRYLHDILGSNIESDKNTNFTEFFKNKGKQDDGSQLDNTIKYTFFKDTDIFIKFFVPVLYPFLKFFFFF